MCVNQQREGRNIPSLNLYPNGKIAYFNYMKFYIKVLFLGSIKLTGVRQYIGSTVARKIPQSPVNLTVPVAASNTNNPQL